MSYATMDCIKTQEELSDDCHVSLHLVYTYYDRYVHAEVGRYLLLETAEAREKYKSHLIPTSPCHQHIQHLITTFESAEMPEPVVKPQKKRGRPPKVAIG